MICDKCNGSGWIYEDQNFFISQGKVKVTCPKCNGKKEIDWLEDIFGVDSPKKFYIIDIDNTSWINPDKNSTIKISGS